MHADADANDIDDANDADDAEDAGDADDADADGKHDGAHPCPLDSLLPILSKIPQHGTSFFCMPKWVSASLPVCVLCCDKKYKGCEGVCGGGGGGEGRF